jgi:hypothetical protein
VVVEVDGGGRRRAVVHKGREVVGCVVVTKGTKCSKSMSANDTQGKSSNDA